MNPMKTKRTLMMGLMILAATTLTLTAGPKDGKHERQLLSRHDTVAEFAGTRQHRCMGLTTLCPDRCGHSGTMATFKIRHYLDYQKPGEYGDPRQEEYLVLVSDNTGKAKIPQATAAAIQALQQGDRVRLVWQHDYVTNDGGSYPERTIIGLETLTPEQADKLIADSKTKATK
jgi:hypothetical protein